MKFKAEMEFRCHAWFKYDQMGQKVLLRCDRFFTHGVRSRTGNSHHSARVPGFKEAVSWIGVGVGTDEQRAMLEASREARDYKELDMYPRELLYGPRD